MLGSTLAVRNFVGSGVLEELEGGETLIVTGGRAIADPASLPEALRYVGAVSEAGDREGRFQKMRRLLIAAHRSRSSTARAKVEARLARARGRRARRARLELLPGVARLLIRWHTARLGRGEEMRRLIEESSPDVVVVPSANPGLLAFDAVRAARALGVPSLVVAFNWDNVSSKGRFPVEPDYLGVWGPQSASHAQRLHGLARDRIFELGAPHLDHYFRHPRGSTDPPFDFRYALFAGSLAPFDELTALERIDREIEDQGLDLRLVYRPHPYRARRKSPDLMDEGRFRHVVLDPQVADRYLDAFRPKEQRVGSSRTAPSLDYYPALLENAAFVVSPLSTMMVEAAIFGRRVVAIAYGDGIHARAPDLVIRSEHLEGLDAIDGFVVAHDEEELPAAFTRLASDGPAPESLGAQIGWWLRHDERTYGQRLDAALSEVVGRGPWRRRLLSSGSGRRA